MINLSTNNWEIKNIETILFDKDGTLVDLHFFWGKMTEFRIKEIIKYYNLKEELFEELCLFLGFNTKTQKMIEEGITALYSRSVIIEMFIKKLQQYGCNAQANTIEKIFDNVAQNFYKDIKKYIKPIPEAIEFLKEAHNLNIKLGLVTADSIESTNLTLEYLDIKKYFNVIIARESHPETKESGKPTLLALEKLKANSNTAIIIGDTPTDALSGKNANLKASILISTGQISTQNLEKHSKYCESSLCNIKFNKMLEKNFSWVSND